MKRTIAFCANTLISTRTPRKLLTRFLALAVLAFVAAVTAVLPLGASAQATGYRTVLELHHYIDYVTEYQQHDTGTAVATAATCMRQLGAREYQSKTAWVVPFSRRYGDGRHRFRLRMDWTKGYMRVVFFGPHLACTRLTPNLGSAVTDHYCRSLGCQEVEAHGTVPRGAAYATIVRGTDASVGVIPPPTCNYCGFGRADFLFQILERAHTNGVRSR